VKTKELVIPLPADRRGQSPIPLRSKPSCIEEMLDDSAPHRGASVNHERDCNFARLKKKRHKRATVSTLNPRGQDLNTF
jgi:hypothetical protein